MEKLLTLGESSALEVMMPPTEAAGGGEQFGRWLGFDPPNGEVEGLEVCTGGEMFILCWLIRPLNMVVEVII